LNCTAQGSGVNYLFTTGSTIVANTQPLQWDPRLGRANVIEASCKLNELIKDHIASDGRTFVRDPDKYEEFASDMNVTPQRAQQIMGAHAEGPKPKPKPSVLHLKRGGKPNGAVVASTPTAPLPLWPQFHDAFSRSVFPRGLLRPWTLRASIARQRPDCEYPAA